MSTLPQFETLCAEVLEELKKLHERLCKVDVAIAEVRSAHRLHTIAEYETFLNDSHVITGALGDATWFQYTARQRVVEVERDRVESAFEELRERIDSYGLQIAIMRGLLPDLSRKVEQVEKSE